MHPADQGALPALKAEGLGQGRVDVLHADPQIGAFYLARLDQLFHDLQGEVDRYRKADADIAAAARKDSGIDADQLAAQIHQRAAGVAGIDRGVGLNEVLIAADVQTAAAQGADDAGGDGLAEAERIADRHHEIAYPERLRVGRCQRAQVFRRDFDDRDVGLRVRADHLGLKLAPVSEGHGDLDRIGDDMIVGQDQAAPGVNDNA